MLIIEGSSVLLCNFEFFHHKKLQLIYKYSKMATNNEIHFSVAVATDLVKYNIFLVKENLVKFVL